MAKKHYRKLAVTLSNFGESMKKETITGTTK